MTLSRRIEDRIVIGISGGIAAYKTPELIRELQRRGYLHFDTILTAAAEQFVTPVTLEALTGRIPYRDTFESGRALSHVDLVQHCGILAVVPATANVLAKFAAGIADDFLTTAYLAASCPVLVAPSMNTRMFEHPATLRNMAQVAEDGARVMEPDAGYLACGTYGRGRLADIATIADIIEHHLHSSRKPALSGLKILIASGGTAEPIDPVRTITNRSSGRMGAELATAFGLSGADVTVVSGTGTARYPAYAKQVPVETAGEMADAVLERAADADVVVMAAAVADYTPRESREQKMKKDTRDLDLKLTPTVDILKTLGDRHSGRKLLVGFAAETESVEKAAIGKLKDKQADLIVGNRVGDPTSGFGTESSEAWLVYRDGRVDTVGDIRKEALAFRIVRAVQELRVGSDG